MCVYVYLVWQQLLQAKDLPAWAEDDMSPRKDSNNSKNGPDDSDKDAESDDDTLKNNGAGAAPAQSGNATSESGASVQVEHNDGKGHASDCSQVCPPEAGHIKAENTHPCTQCTHM